VDLLTAARLLPALAGLLVVAAPARAQLLSPGKLIAAHADLEGVRNCTKCHQLGERGAANAKCLDCHKALADRITGERGFHAGATVTGRNCGECHKDHFGIDFQAIRLDTAGFDHAVVGFTLSGGHATTACRECHQPDYVTDAAVRREVGARGLASTYLGLGTTCVTCHRADDPHENQFGTRGCEECHSEGDWKRPDRFDHAKTRYPLRGRHQDVQCRECHSPIPGRQGQLQLTGIAFGTCASCHAADDPHAGQFAGRACSDCHSERGWDSLAGFDHGATRYPLTGRHRDVTCEQCHQPAAGRPGTMRLRGLDFAACTSCHRNDDPHEGRLGTSCVDCHTTSGWHAVGGPAFERTFDHARTRFPLAGKHAAAACAACHRPERARAKELALTFVAATRTRAYPVPVAEQCLSCHVDYHAGAFRASPAGSDCRSCHGEDGWTPTTFDITRHNRDTKYALTGAHLAAPCLACHKNSALGQTALQFRMPRQECLACHQTLDPHGGQFGNRACDECHATDSFRIAAFDHSRTRYPLDGKHRTVPCASCHPSATGPDGRAVRVYRPLGTACRDCHTEGGA
jgi:hypothetical protein